MVWSAARDRSEVRLVANVGLKLGSFWEPIWRKKYPKPWSAAWIFVLKMMCFSWDCSGPIFVSAACSENQSVFPQKVQPFTWKLLFFNTAPSPITGVIGPETFSCKYESFRTIFQILCFVIPIFTNQMFPESDFSWVGFFPSRIFPESDFSRVGSEVRLVPRWWSWWVDFLSRIFPESDQRCDWSWGFDHDFFWSPIFPKSNRRSDPSWDWWWYLVFHRYAYNFKEETTYLGSDSWNFKGPIRPRSDPWNFKSPIGPGSDSWNFKSPIGPGSDSRKLLNILNSPTNQAKKHG